MKSMAIIFQRDDGFFLRVNFEMIHWFLLFNYRAAH